jgi:hypothetical protein
MAYVALDNGDTAELNPESFTMVTDDSTGRVTLVIPRIAVSVSAESLADCLVSDILHVIDSYEESDE